MLFYCYWLIGTALSGMFIDDLCYIHGVSNSSLLMVIKNKVNHINYLILRW